MGVKCCHQKGYLDYIILIVLIAAAGFCANTKIARRKYIPIGSDENIPFFDGYFYIHTGFEKQNKQHKQWVSSIRGSDEHVINIHDKDQVFSP